MAEDRLAPRLIERGGPGYEEARDDAVWNARKPDRFPRAIVRAGSSDDVVEAVRYARAAGLKVGIRSGGHSWVANGVRDDALLLDLSEMNEIEVDVESRTAVIGPGVRAREIIRALHPLGLTFPAGHNPSVGLGGYILGGGYGWNSRTWGPGCLSVLEADVVLADGSLIHATDATHPDIMWAVRGAGPGLFVVVTRLWLRVHPDYERILQTHYVFPNAVREQVLGWSYDIHEAIAESVEIMVVTTYDPELDDVLVHFNAVACCAPGEGAEVLDFVSSCPVADRALDRVDAQPVTYEDLYAIADLAVPPGERYAVDGIWCDGDVEEILAATREMFDTAPRDRSLVLWMLWGHFPARPDACWSAQAKLYLSTSAGWSDPAEDYEHERWAHQTMAGVSHLSLGTQFSDANLADRFDWGLSQENARRLETLRARYDPESRFHTYMQTSESTTSYARAGRARDRSATR